MGRLVLEATARDGHARILQWSPSDGQTVSTPTLIVPETDQSPLPEWAQVVLTTQPTGRSAVELVSDGTWFHPLGAEGNLVVRAPQPTATHQVQVLDVGGEVAVFHDAGGWASDPKRLVPAFIDAKVQATPGKAFWAPALGTPADYAIWAWLGVDLFDASPLLLAAARGEALTVDGPRSLAEMEAMHGGTWDVDRLMAHNLEAARAELVTVQHAIRTGSLSNLAERRAYASPDAVALLRRFDREHAYVASAAPVQRSEPVPCMTPEALWMPTVERFRRRFQDAYTPPAPADTLVLLPCSARKPYRISQSHRYFGRALDDSGMRHRVHEVMVTSPLGLVPRDLEDSYPANKYDVPVTGHWSRDEEEVIRRQLAALLEAHEYKHVIAHVPASTFTFLRDLLPEDTLHTVMTHRPQGMEDCNRLRDALIELKKRDPQPSDPSMWQQRKLADVQATASYQFGPDAAAALVDGCKAHGRVPHVKLVKDGTQIGTTTMDRGLLSLTLDGADIVAAHGVKRVFIEDFWPRKTGSLFAVGVTHADADVLEGDDVVVVRQGRDGVEVRACGVAQMSGAEMAAMKRGVAVTLRHVRKQEEAS